jgi:hypothetical protein
MRTPKITVALAALAMLAACEDLRPVQWMAPPGVTGRQINQDVATCKPSSARWREREARRAGTRRGSVHESPARCRGRQGHAPDFAPMFRTAKRGEFQEFRFRAGFLIFAQPLPGTRRAAGRRPKDA